MRKNKYQKKRSSFIRANCTNFYEFGDMTKSPFIVIKEGKEKKFKNCIRNPYATHFDTMKSTRASLKIIANKGYRE